MAQNQNKFENIIEQLDLLKKRQMQDRENIKNLTKRQAKRSQKQEENDQQNVTKKIPTILTSAEKRRYQQIGKRFLLGAQIQFSNIKRGIKVKQLMNTTKDFFVKGFEKIKEKGAQLKKSNFWKMLLGSLVVIGMAAYLFRDKIAKLIPDATGQTGNVFQKMIKFLGNMMKQAWQFITETLLGGIGGIINRLFNESIPNMLQMFFYDTLPNAIFNTYLMIMSMFDPGAGQILHARANSQLQTRTDKAIEQMQGIDKDYQADQFNRDTVSHLKILGKIVDNLDKGIAVDNTTQLTKLSNSSFTYLMYYGDDKINQAREKVFSQLNQLFNNTLSAKIKQGVFDAQDFKQTWNAAQNRSLSNRQRLYKSLQSALAGVSEEERNRVLNRFTDEISDSFSNNDVYKALDTMMQRSSQLQGLARGQLDELSGKITTNLSEEQQKQYNKMQQVYKKMSNIFADNGNISNKFIEAAIAGKVSQFMVAAEKFVSNNGLFDHIKENIVSMSNSLAEIFKTFFGNSFAILNSVANSITSYINPSRVMMTQSPTNASGDVVNASQNINGNNIIVNVDLTGNQTIAVSDAINGLSQSENNIVKTIEESNLILGLANKTLAGIGDIHGINMEAWDVLYKLINQKMQPVIVTGGNGDGGGGGSKPSTPTTVVEQIKQTLSST